MFYGLGVLFALSSNFGATFSQNTFTLEKNDVQTQITYLRQVVAQQQIQIQQQTEKNAQQKTQIQKQKEQNAEQEARIAHMEQRLLTTEEQIAQIQHLQSFMTEQEARMSKTDRKTSVADLKFSTQVIGFSAYAGDFQACSEGDLVEYPKTWSNIGNAYNSATSSFTCPVTGLYGFYVSASSDPGHQVYVAIYKESQSLGQVHGDNVDDSQASVLVVITCNRHERVNVRCLRGGNNRVDGGRDNIFSGFLLHAEE